MKAMLLAAGRGNRLRPLTDNMPKPLVPVGGRPLIEHHIYRLAAVGIFEIVINVSYLAEQIIERLGDGSHYGVKIHYSIESQPLEVAGGIINALPLLGPENFLVLNGDIWTDYPLMNLIAQAKNLNRHIAHLVLVNNGPHHPEGDFGLQNDKLLITENQPKFTYSGIAAFSPQFFLGKGPGMVNLLPLLNAAIKQDTITAEYYPGEWYDVGNITAWQKLNERLLHVSTL